MSYDNDVKIALIIAVAFCVFVGLAASCTVLTDACFNKAPTCSRTPK